MAEKKQNQTRVLSRQDGTKRKKILTFICKALPLLLALLQCTAQCALCALPFGAAAAEMTEEVLPSEADSGVMNEDDEIMPLADVSNGAHMLNNKYSGHFISCAASAGKTATLTNGIFEEYEYEFQIYIQEYEIPNTFLIKSCASPDYNLCCQSTEAAVVWVKYPHRTGTTSESDPCCRWYIQYLAGGEYVIRNVKTGAYLSVGMTEGTKDTLRTRSTMGSYGTAQCASCLWRISDNSSFKELSSFQFENLTISSGGVALP